MHHKLRRANVTRTALLLIDIQKGINPETKYFGTTRSTPNFEDNTSSLLAAARRYNHDVAVPTNDARFAGFPALIIHVYHRSIDPESPLYPNKPTHEIMECARPVDGEMVLDKSTNSAFGNPLLEKTLHEAKIRQLIICGLVTDHCVSTSTREAAERNVVNSRPYEGNADGVVVVVGDGTATFERRGFDAQTVHDVNLASLEHEFAEIVTTAQILGIF